MVHVAAVMTALAVFAGALAPVTEPAQETGWIIETAPGAVDAVAAVADKLSTDEPLKLVETISAVAVDLTAAEAANLDSRPDVISVQPDTIMMIDDTQTDAPWHLSRLDQSSAPADASYTYPGSAGAGVRIYVVDSGITPNATQWGTRLLPGTNVAGGETSDCNGHGTHVAGIAASRTYGVAKAALVIPVRVFGCSGSTSSSAVIAGLDWIAANHPVGAPGVINLSLGGPVSPALDSAVASLAAAGFVVTASAGNGGADNVGDDACGESPARVAGAVTVGATTTQDVRAGYSNFGPCVDLFAPGDRIPSLDASNPSGGMLMSGTSMASPVVAGTAALYWGERPGAAAAVIRDVLVSSSVYSTVSSAGTGSPTGLSSVIDASMVSAPQSFTAPTNLPGQLTLTWQPPVPVADRPVLDYALSYRYAGSGWITVADGVSTTTSYTFTAPSPGMAFTFSVRAITRDGTGRPATLELTTATTPVVVTPLPSAAAGFGVTANDSSRLSLGWGAPTTGAPLLDYELAYSFPGASGWFPITVGAAATSYSFTPASAGYTFTFRLRARNSAGFGPASYTTVSTPVATASEPRDFRVTENVIGRLGFQWTTPERPGIAPVSDYELSYTYPGLPYWVTVNDGISAATSHTIINPSAAYTFTFRLRPRTAAGFGEAAYTSVTTAYAPASFPGEPGGIRIAENTSQKLTIDWTAPARTGSSPVTGYVLKYTYPGYPGFVTLPELPASQTDFTFSMPSGGYFFTFLVYARNGSGLGDVASVDVSTPSALPSAPLGFTSTRNEPTNLTLEWQAPASAGVSPVTDYILSYTYPGLPYWVTVNDGVSTTGRFTFTGPSQNMTFTFRVQAKSSAGLGAAAFYALRTAG